jgi:uncharacterized protein
MRAVKSRAIHRGVIVRVLPIVLTLVTFALLALSGAAGAADCRVGSYRLTDGRTVDVAPTDGDTLRWRGFDGTTGLLTRTAEESWTSSLGWTGRPDGIAVQFSNCAFGKIHFDGVAGRRIELDVRETTFVSHGATLSGRLLLPKGAGRVPVVVLVHGAEHDSAREFNPLQRILPAAGVGAFVYDKRGTGLSGGAYTQNFDLLAEDAVAAMREARRLAGSRAARVGYQGGSQAGWVVPMAVNRAPVDFAIVGFGLAVSVIDEDQQEVAIELREKGYSPPEISRALQVASAAELVIASGFSEGFREFDALRSLYKDASWYTDLHGNYTYLLMPYTELELRALAPKFAWETPFRYDPMPVLQANATPQLWILGQEDYEAPSAETSYRLKSLIADGRPFTLALYPGAEHGMTLFETEPKTGERLSTRFAPGYFAMIRDYARDGRLHSAYGNAELTRPSNAAR